MINIYIFTDNEKYIKIGKTKDIQKRKIELQTGNPKKLYLLDLIENVPDSFEKHMHDICKCYLIQGEWFKIEALNHMRKQYPVKSLFKNKLDAKELRRV